MPQVAPTGGLSDLPGDTPRPGTASRGPPSGHAASTREAHAPAGSPTPVPGTAGEDPEFLNSFDATNCVTMESQYTYILKSVDPAVVTIALECFVDYNCSGLDLKMLKAMLRACTQDRAPPVEPPEQQAQVIN